MKKYKLTKVTKEWLGVTFYQIEALRSFGVVPKGEKGGYISKEDNLSQDGDAWVFGNAKVSGDAEVYGDAKVSGDAKVFGDAEVYGDARVYGELKLVGGNFYHCKRKSEEIETIEVSEDYELLARDPKMEEAQKEESLSGKEVTVTLDGKTYKAVIR